ncbi:MAG: GTPase HflX, partial [Bacteroidia bacterium]|nr:GTPase HflX [Bacteroidia bacterium]
VSETLMDIGAANKPIITVFNKIDQYNPDATSDDIFEDEAIYDLATLKKTWMAKLNENIVFVSASKKKNIDELKSMIEKNLEN